MFDLSEVVRGGDVYVFYKYSTSNEVVALPDASFLLNPNLRWTVGVLKARY
jgi:hypothetical protein